MSGRKAEYSALSLHRFDAKERVGLRTLRLVGNKAETSFGKA